MTIGIDPGLANTGVCVLDGGKPVEFETITTKPADGDVTRRIDLIAQRLARVMCEHKPDVVAIEAPYVGTWKRGKELASTASNAMHLAEIVRQLSVIASKFGSEVVMVKPIDGFRALTGSGSGNKARHVQMANLLMPPHLPKLRKTQNHLADALGVAWRGEQKYRLEKSELHKGGLFRIPPVDTTGGVDPADYVAEMREG